MKTTKQNRSARKSHTSANPGSSNVIVISKAKKNPLREGTFCHAQVEAVRKAHGKSVAVAQQILDKSGANPSKRRIEMFWLQKKGFANFKKVA